MHAGFPAGSNREKNPRSQAHYAIPESQVAGHLESRGSNVHAIEKSNNVKQKQKGQEPPPNAMPGALRDL